MADFLFQLAPVQQRRPQSYRFNANLLNYSDEEHRARYRFGRESIEYITNLIEANLRRKTNRGHRFSFVLFRNRKILSLLWRSNFSIYP